MVPFRCRVAIVSLPGATGVAPGRPPTPSNPGVHPATHRAAGAPGDAPGRGKKHTGVYLWTHLGGPIPALHSRGDWERADERARVSLSPSYTRNLMVNALLRTLILYTCLLEL